MRINQSIHLATNHLFSMRSSLNVYSGPRVDFETGTWLSPYKVKTSAGHCRTGNVIVCFNLALYVCLGHPPCCLNIPKSAIITVHRISVVSHPVKTTFNHLLQVTLITWHSQLCVFRQVNSIRSSPAFLSDISHRFSTLLCQHKGNQHVKQTFGGFTNI